MNKPDSCRVLNRLLALHCHSLAMYVKIASPWMNQSDAPAIAAIGHLVNDQEALARRLFEAISERHGLAETGEFPMSFTGIHDVALDYLIGRLIDHQKRDITEIERCVSGLNHDPQARALAEECLGAAKGHLETLEELTVSNSK